VWRPAASASRSSRSSPRVTDRQNPRPVAALPPSALLRARRGNVPVYVRILEVARYVMIRVYKKYKKTT